MYISSRHKQQTSICDSKIQVSSVEKLLGVTIRNTGMLTLITLLKSVILIVKNKSVFYLEETEYCFKTITCYLILISVLL